MEIDQVTVAQPGGQQAGPNEDVDGSGSGAIAVPLLDDPLNMRAGLLVNGVRVLP